MSKNFFSDTTPKEIENLTTERMSSGPSLYYDGFGSYDFQTNFHLIKPLKEIKKKEQKIALLYYTGAPIVGIARWSVPRIGQGHLEVKW